MATFYMFYAIILQWLIYSTKEVILIGISNEQSRPASLQCYSDYSMRAYYNSNGKALDEMKQFEINTRKFITTKRVLKSYVIPVVFHVYGTNFAGKTVNDNTIIRALKKLNDDFHGLNHDFNTVHSAFLGNRSTFDVTFKLARKDPNGSPTTGIIYYPEKSGYGSNARNSEIQAEAWNNYKYCNVYIQLDLFGNSEWYHAGIAWYPDSGMSDAKLARIVYNGQYLYGNTDDEFSSLLTHEFGHWLNLIHTFEDGCTASSENQCDQTGDKVCDTPQTVGNQGCGDVHNCVGNYVNSENYMDYSGAYGCYKMFTSGQVARMEAAMHHAARITLWQNENLIATGVVGDDDVLPRAAYICPNATWISNGAIVAGGSWGTANNKLAYPSGLDVDDEQTVYVTDPFNHRIMAWKYGATTGEIIAGHGYGANGLLSTPTDVIIDRKTDDLIICDAGNRRVIRQSRLNSTNGQTIISNVHCMCLALDDKGALYVSDANQSIVRRWSPGQPLGTVVAGGGGQGDRLDQFNFPNFIFVDRNYSVYVADGYNNRIMKWEKGAKEGIVVAGGRGSEDDPAQLANPRGIIVDQLGTIYVGSYHNSGIKRWKKGATHGDVLIGANGQDVQSIPLQGPHGIAFDRQGNLYVADMWGCQVLRYDIDKSLC
ncbi:unnamed protein product [Rotaria sp. Silwood1]|nr:unnamed protein product [Rotaria sp. Silwood1]CAF1381670.1 unnamed protein product [Rotaria sp. Silwood1]